MPENTRTARRTPARPKVLVVPESVYATLPRRGLLEQLRVQMIGSSQCTPGWRIEHSEFEEHTVVYCLTGKGVYDVTGRQWGVNPGDMFFIYPNTPHAHTADKKDPWAFHWVHFLGAACDPLLDALGVSRDRPVLRVGDDPRVASSFAEIYDTLYLGHTYPCLLHAAACLQQMLSHLALQRNYRASRREDPFELDRIIAFMRRHLAKPLAVETLAASCGLSPSHFSQQFKARTGHSPIDYFIRLKMQRAAELILTTRLKMNRIAAQLGYEDPYYFSRVFRKVMGSAPTQYREQRRAF
ncbi:MAG: AraC family transcriptional regulator [Kiritimatiellae bacterium]|nr:AraC family transcriptional regulator [Kiritimatiellia bacterium]